MLRLRLYATLILLLWIMSSCHGSGADSTAAENVSSGQDVSIYGLQGTATIKNNSGEELTITHDGSYSFDRAPDTESPYSIEVIETPANSTCSIYNSTGLSNDSSLTDMSVICTDDSSSAFATHSIVINDIYLSIPASDGRWIAIKLRFPDHSRYAPDEDGHITAPIVLEVPPTFIKYPGFYIGGDITEDGFIHASILWPGLTDDITGLSSDGEFDYGGAQSTDALRAALLFLTGKSVANDGSSIYKLHSASELQTGSVFGNNTMSIGTTASDAVWADATNVGIYAYSHAGIVATITMAQYGRELSGVGWFVGHENPTQDVISSFDLGRTDIDSSYGNPYYAYAKYNPIDIDLGDAAYASVGWDNSKKGVPYFVDDQGNRYSIDLGEPLLFDKRHFSYRLTRALQENGALDITMWPPDMATPDEARAAWAIRQTNNYYEPLGTEAPGLKVMLLFGTNDHAQPMPDKPHIHQAWDGFHTTANLPWVRLNPDRAYIEKIMGASLPTAPDLDANWAPDSWQDMNPFSYPKESVSAEFEFTRAAIAEMADRTRSGDWSANLSSTLTDQ